MKNIFKSLIFLILCLPSLVYAQVSISASKVADSFERPIASAKLCLAPVDAAANPAGFRIGSVQVVPNTVCGVISNGALQAGLSVAPSPSGIYYHVWAANRTTNAVIRDFGLTQITGSSWTLDSYDPVPLAALPLGTTVGTVTALACGSTPTASLSGAGPYVLNLGIPVCSGSGGSGESGGGSFALSIGSVTTLSYGSQATASVGGSYPNFTLNLGIPQGATGATGPQGPQGPAGTGSGGGTTPTFTIGTITTLSPGSSATVTITGGPNYTINFGLPQGATGATGATGPTGAQGPQGQAGATGSQGAAATVAVGTVTTGAAGSNATVSNSGTPSAAVFNFTIPQGATGPQGPAGATGPTGPQGPAGATGAQGPQGPTGAAGNYTVGQGVSITSNALSTTGVTTSQVPFANSNSLTAAMQIAVVPTTFAFTIPTNGTVSGSSTMRNASSQFYLGTLPSATWTATIYRYPAATAGCLTSTGTSIGTVAITTAGVQTWTVTQTAFAIGDCLVIVAPGAVDTSAANPYGAIAVVD